MTVLIIGLGSMGKRRIRLIKEMYPQFIICGVDVRENRRKETLKLLKVYCYSSIKEAASSQNIECAFVCTSPLSHSKIIKECLDNNWNVFSELNLVDSGYEGNIKLANEKKRKLFLSSTLLYREEMLYIGNRVSDDRKWNYIYHVGQYLPDWHPWESYKDFFIGNKRTNGCRELMAIELPWLTSVFGHINDFNIISDKMTSLDIDFNDNYLIQFIHETGNKGTLIIDVVSPIPSRKLEIYSEKRYISWDGTPETLKEYSAEQNSFEKVSLNQKEEHQEGYSDFIVENAYKNEIRSFFDIIFEDKEQTYGFEQDLEILHLIDLLEGQK